MPFFSGLVFAVLFGYIAVSIWLYFARVMPGLDGESIPRTGRSSSYAFGYAERVEQFRTFKAILERGPHRPWYYQLVYLNTKPWLHFSVGVLLLVLWVFLTWLGSRAV